MLHMQQIGSYSLGYQLSMYTDEAGEMSTSDV